MNLARELSKSTVRGVNNATPTPFFVRGKVIEGTELRHNGPLFDVRLNEILDFLVESGERMKPDKSGYLREAVDRISVTNGWNLSACAAGSRLARPTTPCTSCIDSSIGSCTRTASSRGSAASSTDAMDAG